MPFAPRPAPPQAGCANCPHPKVAHRGLDNRGGCRASSCRCIHFRLLRVEP